MLLCSWPDLLFRITSAPASAICTPVKELYTLHIPLQELLQPFPYRLNPSSSWDLSPYAIPLEQLLALQLRSYHRSRSSPNLLPCVFAKWMRLRENVRFPQSLAQDAQIPLTTSPSKFRENDSESRAEAHGVGRWIQLEIQTLCLNQCCYETQTPKLNLVNLILPPPRLRESLPSNRLQSRLRVELP